MPSFLSARVAGVALGIALSLRLTCRWILTILQAGRHAVSGHRGFNAQV
jgi:hypothetical protein